MSVTTPNECDVESNGKGVFFTRSLDASTVAGCVIQGQAAEALAMSRRTICRWLSLKPDGQSINNGADRSRKNSASQAAKIVMLKSVLKRKKLTDKLGWRLFARGLLICKSIFHQHPMIFFWSKHAKPRHQLKPTVSEMRGARVRHGEVQLDPERLEAFLEYRRVSFSAHLTKRWLWADHGPQVHPTDTVNR